MTQQREPHRSRLGARGTSSRVAPWHSEPGSGDPPHQPACRRRAAGRRRTARATPRPALADRAHGGQPGAGRQEGRQHEPPPPRNPRYASACALSGPRSGSGSGGAEKARLQRGRAQAQRSPTHAGSGSKEVPKTCLTHSTWSHKVHVTIKLPFQRPYRWPGGNITRSTADRRRSRHRDGSEPRGAHPRPRPFPQGAAPATRRVGRAVWGSPPAHHVGRRRPGQRNGTDTGATPRPGSTVVGVEHLVGATSAAAGPFSLVGHGFCSGMLVHRVRSPHQ